MENSGNPFLHFYAGIALILFLIAFLMIFIRAYTRSAQEINHCSNLPLEDDIINPTELSNPNNL